MTDPHVEPSPVASPHRTRLWWIATVLAVAVVAVIALSLRGSDALDDRIYRVNAITAEGLPDNPPPFRNPPPGGEWAVLTEPIPVPGSLAVEFTDISFGAVAWSFESGEIVGRSEIPARDFLLEFRLAALVGGAVQRYIFTVNFDPSPEIELIGINSIAANRLAEHRATTSLGGPNEFETQGHRTTLDIAIDQDTTERLRATDMITIQLEAFTPTIRQILFDLVLGETGRAVFEEAFAEWDVVLGSALR